MELLQAGERYKFGCFDNQTFKVIAVLGDEAFIVWEYDGKTQIVPIEKDELAEVINE